MLYLIRHAATDQPLLREPGDLTPATPAEWALDYGLSPRGELEAQELGAWLARLERPDRVLASPRRRTQETLRIACAEVAFDLDPRLHEWHDAESCDALQERVRSLLQETEEAVVWAFTHGGFIRAAIAALLVGDDRSRFAATFHDLRRALHVWNASVSLVAHGASGLEVYALNGCATMDRLLGRS